MWENIHTLTIPETTPSGGIDANSELKVKKIASKSWQWYTVYKEFAATSGIAPTMWQAKTRAKDAYRKLKKMYWKVR